MRLVDADLLTAQLRQLRTSLAGGVHSKERQGIGKALLLLAAVPTIRCGECDDYGSGCSADADDDCCMLFSSRSTAGAGS